ncbi:MAG: hypothetical protein M3041_09495 [Acidobacteriota bacterium]|nr:hypothetical protein [Acidobacteriota bacterium]
MEFAENRIAFQKLRVHYRNCADEWAQADFEEFIEKEAKSTGVIGLELTREESVPVLQPDGHPSPLRLQLLHMQGGGNFYDLHRLLGRVAWYRDLIPLDFATLKLTAHDRDQPMRLVNALAAVDNDWSSQSMRISEVHFVPPTLTMHGVALGDSARSAVIASLLNQVWRRRPASRARMRERTQS